MENIVRSQNKDVDADSVKKIVPFQVSLSLDSFHKDAMMRDFKFIEHFAHTDIPGAAFKVNVSSIRQDKNMFQELIKKFVDSGIHVGELFMVDSTGKFGKKMYDLNGNVIVSNSNGTLFNGGRAKNIDFAYKTPFPQFVFMTPDHISLVAFDSFGNVTLGENCGKKISVPWIDSETQTILPMETVKANLVSATKQAEQDFLAEHSKMNAYFNFVRDHLVK